MIAYNYNNRPIPKEEKDIILPNHIRIFMDQPLLDTLSSKDQTTTGQTNTKEEKEEEEEDFYTIKPKEGKEFYKEAMEKGRSVCWSKKGLVDHNAVEDKWKYDRHALNTNDKDNNNINDKDNINTNDSNSENNLSDSNGNNGHKCENDNCGDEQTELFTEGILT